MAVLTQQNVDDLVAQYTASSKDQYIKDEALRGLELKLAKNTGTATWTIYGRIRNSKNQRVTLGKHPQMQLQEARRQAVDILAQYDQGIDPVKARKDREQEQEDAAIIEQRKRISLHEMLRTHITLKRLKPSSTYDYENTIRVCFPHWMDKAVQDIGEFEVQDTYERLIQQGKVAQTEKAFRYLSAVMNTAKNRRISGGKSNSASYTLIDDNPVDVLKGLGLRTRASRRRQDVLSTKVGRNVGTYLDTLVELLENQDHPEWGPSGRLALTPVVRDYIQVLLFTGIRKAEALTLRWEDVHIDHDDINDNYFQIHDTKNGMDFLCPISIPVLEALGRRKASRINEWVFPSSKNRGLHIANPRKQLIKLSEYVGTKITNHTFRRTFASAAHECGLTLHSIKEMLNHKSSDVTAGYIISSVSSLTPRFQQVADMIMKHPLHHDMNNPQPFVDADDDDDF